MTWRRLDLVVGLLTVAVFLGTGLYMKTQFPALYGDNQTVRFLYRANHIYILLGIGSSKPILHVHRV